MEQNDHYIGNELDLFAFATNWKNYWSNQIRSYLGNKVMEVGAGLGGSTAVCVPKAPGLEKWVCLEPDADLAFKIPANIASLGPKKNLVSVVTDILNNYDPGESFDSILYIDVIEHIKNDREELELAAKRLNNNGHLIILVPAHNFLFSPFDKAIGHYRRYNKKMIREILPDGVKIVTMKYLDSVGLLSSLANKLILKQSSPTKNQVLFWDKCIVPLSRILDRCIFFLAGKSLVVVVKRK